MSPVVSQTLKSRMPLSSLWMKQYFCLDMDLNYLHNVIDIVLGEFEYFILSSTARLGDDAYGAAIRKDLELMTGRECSLGALYTTVDRLEQKGLIRTWMGEPTPERGGRAKKMVRITAKGVREAQAFYEAVVRVSVGVAWAIGGVDR
jgi:PadR family transcriptional regulator, regulatory protein PadR